MTRVSVRWLLLLAGLVGIVPFLMAGCSGGGGATQQQQPDTHVDALPGDRAEMKIALPDGTFPCGLGQVVWGHQIFDLKEYPTCKQVAPALTVYCLNDQAQWTNDAITIAETSADTVTIEAQREGICGLFPKK